jgi:hypothetical protein
VKLKREASKKRIAKKLRQRTTFTFAVPFSARKQACGPEARALREKSIGLVISDCGFRIADFFGFLLQSAFRNRHSAFELPARSKK